VKHEIIWNGELEDAYVTASGAATVEAMDDCRRSLTSDSRFRSGIRVLIDHRQVDWSGMTHEDVLGVINLLSRDASRFGFTYCAMVMGKQVDFGIARMQQQYAEIDSELQIEFRVFSTIEDARDWLRTLPKPDPPAAS
jgi:hypothetical protein